MSEPSYVGTGTQGNEGSKHFKVVTAERIKVGTTVVTEEPTYAPGSKYAVFARVTSLAGDYTYPPSPGAVFGGPVPYTNVTYDLTGDFDGTNATFTYPASETKPMMFTCTATCNMQIDAADVPMNMTFRLFVSGLGDLRHTVESRVSAQDAAYSVDEDCIMSFVGILNPGGSIQADFALSATTGDSFVGTKGHFSLSSLGYVTM